MLFDDPATLVS